MQDWRTAGPGTSSARTLPWVKPTEHPVMGDSGPGDSGSGEPREMRAVSEVVAVLQAAQAQVRELFDEVMRSGADQRVSERDLADVVAAAASLERAASAVGVSSMAGYARREPHDLADDPSQSVVSIRARGFVHEWAAAEIGHLVRVSSRSADSRVTRAADLASVMPHTLAVVADGDLELWQAEKALAILREAGTDDETTRLIDGWLAQRVAGVDPTRIPTLTRVALGRFAPDLLPAAAATNRAEQRALERWEFSPGMTEMTARIPTEKAAAIWEAASVLGKEYRQADPSLSLDQARCDAFVDLILTDVSVTAHVTLGVPVVTSAYAATGQAPMPGRDVDDPGVSPDSEPTPQDPSPWGEPSAEEDPSAGEGPSPGEDPWASAGPPPRWGPAEHVPEWAAHPDYERDPQRCAPVGTTTLQHQWWLSGVHLPGVGYIPPDVMQSLTSQLGTVISTALLDATRGILLSYVHDAYRPTAAMRAMVQARDGRCRAFGCTRSVERCDLDHATPYDQDGPTSGENLAGLCRMHHRAKQAKAWTYYLDPDTGVTWWINSRTGARRTTIADVSIGVRSLPLMRVDELPVNNGDDRLTPETLGQIAAQADADGWARLDALRPPPPEPTPEEVEAAEAAAAERAHRNRFKPEPIEPPSMGEAAQPFFITESAYTLDRGRLRIPDPTIPPSPPPEPAADHESDEDSAAVADSGPDGSSAEPDV